MLITVTSAVGVWTAVELFKSTKPVIFQRWLYIIYRLTSIDFYFNIKNFQIYQDGDFKTAVGRTIPWKIYNVVLVFLCKAVLIKFLFMLNGDQVFSYDYVLYIVVLMAFVIVIRFIFHAVVHWYTTELQTNTDLIELQKMEYSGASAQRNADV